jgi:DNA polymerase-1
LAGAKYLYLDFETTSGNTKLDALNVWKDCYIAGACVTVDDCPDAWYVPVCHHRGGNLPWEPVYKWLEEVVNSCGTWVNHNVKYDMHVFSNNLGVEVNCKVTDTLAHAKILNSDRMRYGLDFLSRDWLSHDISHHEKVMKPYLKDNKDFGWIPADVMASYGTDDVFVTRKLHRYLQDNISAECKFVCDLEDKIAMCLYHIERSGMNINVTNTMLTQLKTLHRMSTIDDELESLIGYSIRANSDEDCFDVICNAHGLPVIAYTDNGSPSFDKHALRSYMAFPGAPVEVLKLMLEYRRLATFNGTFLSTYLERNIDGVLHPSYNASVRTGRMSCSKPNMQQLMPEAKELVEPREGHILISCDYSQIEYRTIVHYIKDPDAIEAYNKNPDQDYHMWVADLCGIKRKPAKTVNFLMAFGGGKARLINALSVDPDVVESIDTTDVSEFNRLAKARGNDIYNTYHAKLPGLKRTSREAEMLCRQRGYVRNLYGRRRHLPADHARKAFNTANQSSAADLMKERMVALMEAGYEVIGSVHDELIITMPKEQYTEDTQKDIARILEKPSINLRIPIRVGIGASTKSWLDASSNSKPVYY